MFAVIWWWMTSYSQTQQVSPKKVKMHNNNNDITTHTHTYSNTKCYILAYCIGSGRNATPSSDLPGCKLHINTQLTSCCFWPLFLPSINGPDLWAWSGTGPCGFDCLHLFLIQIKGKQNTTFHFIISAEVATFLALFVYLPAEYVKSCLNRCQWNLAQTQSVFAHNFFWQTFRGKIPPKSNHQNLMHNLIWISIIYYCFLQVSVSQF